MLTNLISEGKPLKRSEKKRIDILLSAQKAFLEKGYDTVSMDTIAENAGVSKRTVYSHFGSKEELFGGIMIAACEAKRDAFLSSLDPEKSTEEVLTELGRLFLAEMFDPETIALLRILIGNVNQLPGLGEEFFDGGPREIVDELAAYLREKEKKGELKIDDPECAAASFMGSLIGNSQMRALITNLPLPDAEKIEDMVSGSVDCFLNGVRVR